MKAVIDRFENDYAVVLFGEEEIKVDIPSQLLPDEVSEGTWLEVSFTIDQETSEDRERKIGNLIDKLKNN
ncbi:DUF3006 domain-containing protein [Natroniella sulfidigena]|uniref:DUF3006 domain-containing protein n=1 Tax=Natroniella sulfidigena TaxID=723921 RepID=UPI00200B7A43|nr:DUF3006 domain-containing protein [Natroniella sulfidigena]MCK8817679.1 DUF3006 domain-containing protein [Natroniella sulfidigena]